MDKISIMSIDEWYKEYRYELRELYNILLYYYMRVNIKPITFEDFVKLVYDNSTKYKPLYY